MEIEVAGELRKLENDVVFEMIGAELPLPFLKRVGIRLAGAWYWQSGWPRP